MGTLRDAAVYYCILREAHWDRWGCTCVVSLWWEEWRGGQSWGSCHKSKSRVTPAAGKPRYTCLPSTSMGQAQCWAGTGVMENSMEVPQKTDNPLQYSCLENSMDRGGWQATVQGVTESQT